MAEVEIKNLYSSKSLGWRHVQTILLFMGMTIALSLRTCMSVAVVAMRNSSSGSNFPQYDWDQPTSTTILGSFFWGYIVTQLPVGYFIRTGSALNVLVLGMLLNSVVNMLMPWLAEINDVAVMCGRVVMGLGQGCLMPCVQTLISRWIPPMERARLGSSILNGLPFGTVVGMLISGLLAGSRFGWPSIFYFFGILGIIWCILFYWLGTDYPLNHSKISSKEVEYINKSLNSLNNSADDKPPKVPWILMLKSVPLWAMIVAGCGDTWGFYTFMTQLPTYMKYALNYDISKSGTISALPYIAMWLLGFPIYFLSDYALSKGVSTAIVRKTCAVIAFWTPALCLLVLGIVTITNKTVIVCIFVITIGFGAAVSSSVQINPMDLAPNYVGPIVSFSNTISDVASLGVPYMFKIILQDPIDINQWHAVFFITGGILFFSNLIFLIWGRCDVQPWNNPDK